MFAKLPEQELEQALKDTDTLKPTEQFNYTVKPGTWFHPSENIIGVPVSASKWDTKIDDKGLTVDFNLYPVRSFVRESGLKKFAEFVNFITAHSKYNISSLLSHEGYIDEKGAKSLAQYLKSDQCTLRYLDLLQTYIKEEDLMHIVDALRENKSLVYINLRGTKVTQKVIDTLLEIVRSQNKNLEQMELVQGYYENEKKLISSGAYKALGDQLIANHNRPGPRV